MIFSASIIEQRQMDSRWHGDLPGRIRNVGPTHGRNRLEHREHGADGGSIQNPQGLECLQHAGGVHPQAAR